MPLTRSAKQLVQRLTPSLVNTTSTNSIKAIPLNQIQALSQLSGSSILANANSEKGCRQNGLGAVLIGSF